MKEMKIIYDCNYVSGYDSENYGSLEVKCLRSVAATLDLLNNAKCSPHWIVLIRGLLKSFNP